MRLFLPVMKSLENLEAYRTEWMIFASAERLAGSIDFVAKNRDGNLVLYDWKRSKNLRNKYSCQWSQMNGPVQHLADCAGIHYRLQLNSYKWILESYYNVVVADMFVVCTHPDNGEAAFIDHVPHMPQETEALMQYQRGRVREVEAMGDNDIMLGPFGGGGGFDDANASEFPPSPPPREKRRRLTSKTNSNPATPTASQTRPSESQMDAEAPGGGAGSSAAAGSSSGAMQMARQPHGSQDDLELMRAQAEAMDLGFCGERASSSAAAKPMAKQPHSSQEALELMLAEAEAMDLGLCEDSALAGPRAPGLPGASSTDAVLPNPIEPAPLSAGPAFPAVPHELLVPKADIDSMDVGAIASEALDVFEAFGSRLEVDDQMEDDIMKSTAALREFVSRERPDWSDELQHLAVGALFCARHRLIDTGMREHVHLLYIIAGGHYLRAHSGTAYYYSNGAFRPFLGVPPQTVLARVKEYLLRLEGLFRSLRKETKRSEGTPLLDAIDTAIADCGGPRECVSSWVTSALKYTGPPRFSKRAGGEDGQEEDGEAPAQGAGYSWPSTQAYAVSKVAASLQRELLSKAVIIHFIEWCETPNPVRPGIATTDTCLLFDTDEGPMVQVPKSPNNNIYLFVPLRLLTQDYSNGDIKAATKRLLRFWQTTFWRNGPAFKAQLAAMGLILRGLNVDRAFWTKGPGGVGQSLNSFLIAALFQSLHEFLDMNIYYSDDELRKQGDALHLALIHTGQENVGTAKQMRDDLYKKHITADPAPLLIMLLLPPPVLL